FMVVLFFAGLVLLEPDMGTAFSICVIGILMLYNVGVKLKYLFSLMMLFLPAVLYVVIAAPYRLQRLVTFWDPWKDPKGAGFQLIQSFIALGSGGLWGLGLGESRQKLFYLPQSHTDFVYSIIGEETGFLGAVFVLLLFATVIVFLLIVSNKIHDPFISQCV
ncbi:MAG: FtsW/RodA/SpoVE family cell cycle protein, partial [Candidatus Omnitrophica bacterium]|nr:FtsW/RodA/SpoVE family cell cycle protein [Candidatus Omnitrophota bacterium]